ncbi:hypothetical protein BISA_0797 [Bifidobacterium saguini DSM 23967]|uniref:Uncharacterized protein n=1 Tax=Bifidobacterium saguini DSM 23967 TaxID=1437607 RepID=A0A087DA47_9BIFI|nr:hypothetical protein BISA_0797 [Bifidobacterium saguini DSM 23967]
MCAYPCQAKFQSAPSVRRVTNAVSTPLAILAFQSAPSVRRVTALVALSNASCMISIRTLREEGDNGSATIRFFAVSFQSAPSVRRVTGWGIRSACMRGNFNPHPP